MSNVDRLRENIAALESAWHTIAEYAEREDLIAVVEGDWPVFALGMLTADGDTEPRAASALKAMNWLVDESKLQTAILNEMESECDA